MRKPQQELREYAYQELMYEINKLSVRIKAHLYGSEEMKSKVSMPTVKELDDILMKKVMDILRKDSKPLIKR